jgi:excisionase family DNA binding protein
VSRTIEHPGHVEASATSGLSPTPRLLTADDVAERWQVSTDLVYELTRAGELPVVKLGRRYRYRLEAIEEFECAGGGA